MTDEIDFSLTAILRGIGPHEVVAQVAALAESGFRTIEIPLNSPDWAESFRRLQSATPAGVTIGAGTVVDEAHLDTLHGLGVRFVLSPCTEPALIARARALGMAVMPGIATPSEAFAAYKAGATALKIFPADVLGPGFVKALKAVMPPVPMIAVGGVNLDNLTAFIAAGCAGAGIGGDLYRAGQSVDSTRAKAAQFIERIRKILP